MSTPALRLATTTVQHSISPAAVISGSGEFVMNNIRSGFQTLVTWQKRYEERQQLRNLSDSVLKDIGIERIDAEQESQKPFWLN